MITTSAAGGTVRKEREEDEEGEEDEEDKWPVPSRGGRRGRRDLRPGAPRLSQCRTMPISYLPVMVQHPDR
ncbi:hypothetical protein [Streptomyces sp. Rer75]|uniref:hypothetical protein n=1 Tax=unclassified Streptomyces TaxID=2593676 RepID=UPI0015CF8AF5|nr:hypothetical protein [Streptomyces sp. Rer75]QLH19273.1 hypothetical protein HYQ63_38545 [Streptomyces sp. Rer75]